MLSISTDIPWKGEKEMFGHDQQSGLGLIELIVSMTIVAALASFAVTQFASVQNLQRFVETRDRLIVLENLVRFAITNDRALKQTIKKNQTLATCMKQAGNACKPVPRPLALWLSSKTRIDGTYELDGRRCQGSACPVDMKLEFYTSCKGNGACERVKVLYFSYKLYVEGILFKKGLTKRIFENSASDEGALCESDDSGRTKFASSIFGGKMTCTPSPGFSRKLTGISPQDCKVGKEVLVGYSADGKAICEKIKFSESKR